MQQRVVGTMEKRRSSEKRKYSALERKRNVSMPGRAVDNRECI